MKNLFQLDKRLLFGFIFILAVGAMNAQQTTAQISSDQLEITLADKYDQLSQGTIDKFDVKIAEIFTGSLMKAVEGSISFAQAIEQAAKKAEQAYPNQSQKIQTIRNEYADLVN